MALDNLQQWFHYGRDNVLRTDFALYYAFARIGLTAGWDRLYDLEAQRQVYESMGPLWWFALPYTPPMAWLVAPFTMLPLSAAYWTWAALLAGALLFTWWLAAPADPLVRLLCLAAALSPYATLLGLAMGQVIVFQLLAVALCAWLLRCKRPLVAGLALVPIALHPQGYLLVPPALFLAGHRRAALVWTAGAAVLAGLSIAALGLSGTEAYLGRLWAAERSPLEFAVAYPVTMPLLVEPHHRLRLAAQAGLVLIVALAAWRHRRGPAELPLAIGLLGSVLLSSFLHLDDLMVLIVAAWLVLRTRTEALTVVPIAAIWLTSLFLTHTGTETFGPYFVLAELGWLASLALLPLNAVAEGTHLASPGRLSPS